MAVPTSMSQLGVTDGANSPVGTESVGTNLDNYIRANAFITRRESARGADITATGTINLLDDGNYFVVTGATTIVGIATAWVGRKIYLKFSGTPVLTHNATTFILPTGANITAAAGDIAVFVEESIGNWRCLSYLRANGRPLASINLGTQQITTSGTVIDFLGLPAGLRRVSIMLNGVSQSGTSDMLLQIGDVGEIETSGYIGTGTEIAVANNSFPHSTGFGIITGTPAASNAFSGTIVLSLEDIVSNSWTESGIISRTDGVGSHMSSGRKALSGVLDRIRLTMANGTSTFDAGTVNVSHEF